MSFATWILSILMHTFDVAEKRTCFSFGCLAMTIFSMMTLVTDGKKNVTFEFLDQSVMLKCIKYINSSHMIGNLRRSARFSLKSSYERGMLLCDLSLLNNIFGIYSTKSQKCKCSSILSSRRLCLFKWICDRNKWFDSKAKRKMVRERVPIQIEIYWSYLVTTRSERIEGILLKKNECRKRFVAGRKRFQESNVDTYDKYERLVLDSLRFRLVNVARQNWAIPTNLIQIGLLLSALWSEHRRHPQIKHFILKFLFVFFISI